MQTPFEFTAERVACRIRNHLRGVFDSLHASSGRGVGGVSKSHSRPQNNHKENLKKKWRQSVELDIV